MSNADHDIFFMPLGGGQEVGASCYFVKMGDSHMLLDCGKKITPRGLTAPNFFPLLQPPFLESMSQIHQIFLSHSHYDHLGNLPAAVSSCFNAGVYATPVTKSLARYMLWDVGGYYMRGASQAKREQNEILTSTAVDRIISVGFCQPVTLPGCKVTFYEAGHIPGAAMILIQTEHRSLLYTGDFSCGETALTSGYILPKDLRVDTLIICGLHAKHPEFTHSRQFAGQMHMLRVMLQQGKSVHLRTTQLTKGLEMLMMINRAMDAGFPKRNVYIDESVLTIAEKMESLHIPVLREGNYRAGYHMEPNSISIGKRAPLGFFPVSVDFSLHPNYYEVRDLILNLNPKTTVLVHTSPAYDATYENTLETELFSQKGFDMRVVFAENGQNYVL